MKLLNAILFSLISCYSLAQGPYPPAAGQSGTTAIHKDSSVFITWASASTIERGWQNIANKAAGKTTAGDSLSPIGKSGLNGVVSLGDSGVAILTFDGVIIDGPGADFAVFENSFDGMFLELAFVEVSSDGINFYRFDAVSLTDTSSQTNSFGNTNPTEIHNLAGKYQLQYGTPFDLNELSGIPGLDINSISHVKIVDVIGNISETYASHDSQNTPVNDPWPTEFPTGGFDLDAVGVINFSPTSIHKYTNETLVSLYPNPFSDLLVLDFGVVDNYSIEIYSIDGTLMNSSKTYSNTVSLKLAYLDAGVYIVKVSSLNRNITKRVLKY